MKHARQLPVIALVPMLCAAAIAEPRYKSKTEMIRTADAIAIVDITRAEDIEEEGRTDNGLGYDQKATAMVEKSLKGGLAGQVTLSGWGRLSCPSSRFETGRYLVFLRRDGDRLAGDNSDRSALKVDGDMVKWFADASMYSLKDAPLADVLGEIEQASAKQE